MTILHTTQTQSQQAPTSFALPSVLHQLFIKRGFSEEEIADFLTWDLKTIPDLTQMLDVKKAALRIIEAIEKREKIGIYGDYDVDGTTSCALFYHFFHMLNVTVEIIQPSRFIEGYGLHPSGIDQALQKNISLLITVDCGISSNEAADYALTKNMDLIITDHHKDACAEMPRAYAVVNPNRRDEDETSTLRSLAGVGVAFAVSLQVKKQLETENRPCPSIYPLLQFVAVGTLCDLAMLTPVNLKLVRHGLKQICQSPYPGMKVFLKPEDVLNKQFVNSEKISFHFGPLINSKGRLDHPEKALRVLIASNSDEARENYAHLEISNRERKFIQAEVFQEAKEQIQDQLEEIKSEEKSDHVISIAFSPEWHEGVIGIVASKLVETFKVPAVVFTKNQEGNYLKASARTAGTLDIFRCLDNCRDLFEKFGGHQAAAGLSLKAANLPLLRERLNQQLKQIPHSERTVQESYDLDIDFSAIDVNLVKSLDRLEPFGRGNNKPKFRMNGVRLESFSILKDLHVRWSFAPLPSLSPRHTHLARQGHLLKGISFNYVGKLGALTPDEIIQRQNEFPHGLSVQFTLGINTWNNNEYLQLQVEKISFALNKK